MKNFFQLREELSQLNEMEMLTHKKKIAAAKQKVTDLHHNFTKASEHHFKQADAMTKQHGPDHPKTKMHRAVGRHLADTAYALSTAAKPGNHSDHYIKRAHGSSNRVNNLAKEYSDGKSKHSIQGMATHTSKLHKALSSALSAHQDAIKNSPAGKVKTAVNKIKSKLTNEAKVDEISNKTLDAYKSKAFKQYNMSRKRQDSPYYTDKKQAFHKARVTRRHKGIGSVYKRDDARRNPDGSHAAKYIHKWSAGERIRTGTADTPFGGDTLRNKPSSALPKTYRDPNRK